MSSPWKESFAKNLWHVYLLPNSENGLRKPSAVDILQARSVDHQRFVRKLGMLSLLNLQEITSAVAAVIEYQA